MQKRETLKTLNWFYTLELNQVDLYNAQSKSVNDIYLKNVLERVADIERQHVDNIAEKIKELDAKPTVIGDVFAPISGMIAGKITSWTGLINMFKANIRLEKRAMADYKDFILRTADPHLFDVLWSNLIDEDLHTTWFTNKIKELEKLL